MGKPIHLTVKDLTKYSDNLLKYKSTLTALAKRTIDKTCQVGLIGNYQSATQKETEVSGSIVKGGIKAPKETKFAEYGTGVYAEKAHIGQTTTFVENGYNKWYIPVESVTHDVPYQVINIKGEDYYVARPQVAQHRFFTCSERMRAKIKQIAHDEFIGGINGITKYLQ